MDSKQKQYKRMIEKKENEIHKSEAELKTFKGRVAEELCQYKIGDVVEKDKQKVEILRFTDISIWFSDDIWIYMRAINIKKNGERGAIRNVIIYDEKDWKLV